MDRVYLPSPVWDVDKRDGSCAVGSSPCLDHNLVVSSNCGDDRGEYCEGGLHRRGYSGVQARRYRFGSRRQFTI